MDSDTFYGDFMVKLIWRLLGNLIYHVFSMENLDDLHTIFTIKSPYTVSQSTLSPYSRHTNHSGHKIYHGFSITTSDMRDKKCVGFNSLHLTIQFFRISILEIFYKWLRKDVQQTRWFRYESETNNSQSDLTHMSNFAGPILPHNQILCLHHFNLRSLYFQSL